MSEEIVKQSEEIVKASTEEGGEKTTSDTASTGTEPNTDKSQAERGEVIQSGISSDDKTMGMLAHLLGIFTTFVGPLVIWLTKKESSSFVEEEAREALNFQISLMIYYAVITVATTVLTIVTFGLFGMIAPFIYPGLGIFALVVMIMGTLQAKEGEHYKYPLCIRFIK